MTANLQSGAERPDPIGPSRLSVTRYGWAGQTYGYECGPGTYPVIGGAFEEADAFRLPSGVVLAKSPRFDRGTWGAPAVVTSDEWVCVDADGPVVSLGPPPNL